MQEKLGIYTLMLLLRLREKHVQGIKHISDLFYQNADLQCAVTREVVACKGRNVLFILDGFNELPTDLRHDSFLLELIQGKHLPECTVLVTSRPLASSPGLLIGRRGKEGLVSTACACATFSMYFTVKVSVNAYRQYPYVIGLLKSE